MLAIAPAVRPQFLLAKLISARRGIGKSIRIKRLSHRSEFPCGCAATRFNLMLAASRTRSLSPLFDHKMRCSNSEHGVSTWNGLERALDLSEPPLSLCASKTRNPNTVTLSLLGSRFSEAANCRQLLLCGKSLHLNNNRILLERLESRRIVVLMRCLAVACEWLGECAPCPTGQNPRRGKS